MSNPRPSSEECFSCLGFLRTWGTQSTVHKDRVYEKEKGWGGFEAPPPPACHCRRHRHPYLSPACKNRRDFFSCLSILPHTLQHCLPPPPFFFRKGKGGGEQRSSSSSSSTVCEVCAFSFPFSSVPSCLFSSSGRELLLLLLLLCANCLSSLLSVGSGCAWAQPRHSFPLPPSTETSRR